MPDRVWCALAFPQRMFCCRTVQTFGGCQKSGETSFYFEGKMFSWTLSAQPGRSSEWETRTKLNGPIQPVASVSSLRTFGRWRLSTTFRNFSPLVSETSHILVVTSNGSVTWTEPFGTGSRACSSLHFRNASMCQRSVEQMKPIRETSNQPGEPMATPQSESGLKCCYGAALMAN